LAHVAARSGESATTVWLGSCFAIARLFALSRSQAPANDKQYRADIAARHGGALYAADHRAVVAALTTSWLAPRGN
jgi:hypothetical protein